MKLMIASDIHGSAYWCEKLLEAWRGEGMPRRPEGIAAGRLPEGRLQPAAPQFLWIEDADHLLRHLPQLATPTDYNTYLPMAQEAIQAIVNFILQPAEP